MKDIKLVTSSFPIVIRRGKLLLRLEYHHISFTVFENAQHKNHTRIEGLENEL